LLVAVFGYYFGVIGAIFAAANAKSITREEHAKPEPAAVEEGKP
jgi:hypothetical protein